MELLRRREAADAQVKSEQLRIKRERVEAGTEGEEDDDEDAPEIVEPPPKRQRVIQTIDLTSD